MRKLKLSTARDILLFMVDSTDHLSGKAGLTLTITASKDAAAFASISPTVVDRSNGWYSVSLTSTHTNTLGDLALHATGTGADPSDLLIQVVPELPGALSTTERDATADALLNRDMSVGTDSGSPTVRTVRQALRFLRNKWSLSGATLTVTKEDDSTASWTSTVTATAGADPITGNDPA